MDFLSFILDEAVQTAFDLAPIIALAAIFQFAILRQPMADLPRILIGLAYLAIGLTCFRIGISESLIPIGRDMARQLVTVMYASGSPALLDYLPILTFATLIGFTATLIEPTVITATEKLEDLSGGALRARVVRMLIACGVAIGLLLGTSRILLQIPLVYLLASVAFTLIVLALTAPREIVPLALDSGGIATSAVTVPLIAAYGAAVAESIPRATSAADGFGLIILALFFPAVLLLAFAQIQARMMKAPGKGGSDAV